MKLAILILCGSGIGSASLSLREFYSRFKEVLTPYSCLDTVKYILSVNAGEAEAYCRKFASENPDVDVFVPSCVGGDGKVTDAGAGRYVYGLQYAAKDSDFVLEIDAEGAHNPMEAARLIDSLLNGNFAAFSTRFSNGGRNLYPVQRRLSSIAITILSNVCLGLGRVITDMTSGFEAFRSDLLNEIFRIHCPSDWITMRTTTALIQTELRACVVWYVRKKFGKEVLYTKISISPITYGGEKQGRNFGKDIATKALQGFFMLLPLRKNFLEKV